MSAANSTPLHSTPQLELQCSFHNAAKIKVYYKPHIFKKYIQKDQKDWGLDYKTSFRGYAKGLNNKEQYIASDSVSFEQSQKIYIDNTFT